MSLVWTQSSITNVSATIGPATTQICDVDYWLSSIIMASVLETISLYILTTLATFSWRSRNRRSISRLNHLCLLAALLAFLYCTSTLLALLPEVPNRAMTWTQAVFYWIGMSLNYTVLWLRQRRFYSDKLLANKVSNCHRIFSSAVIIGIYIFLAILVFAFLSIIDFTPCATLRGINHILPVPLSFAFYEEYGHLFYMIAYALWQFRMNEQS
ncbi:unnamed protein product [Clavelina lepadiformis]|uniref:Uncharacterized protein n=1 Tax=Clavelina lepadiformis TaxID=159417 RepID=A0ABP0GM91_CLALP